MSEKNLIEARLQQALTSKTPLTLLINGKQRITGLVKAFDAHMVLMDCGRTTQAVYRHALTDLTNAATAGRAEKPFVNRAQAPSKGSERKNIDRRNDRPREKTPAAPSGQRKEPEQQASQPQAPTNPMTGALGEELRKWLQRTSE